MKTKYSLVLIILLLILNISYSQINTPAGATWPFGSRIQQFPTAPYPFGIIPTNLPAGAYTPASNLYARSQDAYVEYNEWKACYAYNCGTGQWRIRFDNTAETVSEGIGYGMLLAAYAADKTLFDGLWAYYKAHVNVRGLMNWHIGNGGASACANTVLGTNAASDSEMDAAMALIIADCQWPLATAPYDYSVEATYIISRIRLHEIPTTCATGNNQISNGDGWILGCGANNDCRNPSYQAPAYVKHFQGFDGGAPANFWNTTVFNTIYPMLNANRNATSGLVSNWCFPTGAPSTVAACATPFFQDHGYDAIRNPWRMATDYIWWGDVNGRNISQLISTWISTKTVTLTAPANLRGPVAYNGTNNGRTLVGQDAIFTSMWGAATLGVATSAANQNTANFMYTRTMAIQNPQSCTAGSGSGYYGNTLRMISLFMMTGNFWKPCEQPCAGPTFAADSVSVCGGTTVILDGGIATAAGRTFQWYRNNAVITGATSPTLSVSATTPVGFVPPGWYREQLNDNGCIRKDSVYVKLTVVKPDLGLNIKLCSGSSITLNANILASGYTYQWQYSGTNYAGLADINGATNSTLLNVRIPGLYKVSIAKAGCTAAFDTITITSFVATPNDACITTAPGSVVLSVTGSSAASQYDWYNVATAGSILAGGTGTYTYNTGSLAAGTYTYYVKDNSRQYGRMGKIAPTSPPVTCAGMVLPIDGITAGWGTDNHNIYSHVVLVNRTIDIDSVTVWFCLYNNAMPTVVFRLTNAAGSTILQTTVARPGIRIVNAGAPYGPPYNGLMQGVRYYVGINGVAPGTYRLIAPTVTYVPALAFANMLIEQHPTNVAYSYKDNIDGNTASITNTFGYTTTYANRYAHFYDWTISAVNNCDRVPVIAYIGSCPAALPVTLNYFKGKTENGKVNLAWSTSEERNAAYFMVQRSSDGENFYNVGKVLAIGNSNINNVYSFEDDKPLRGVSYYRLALYDIDESNTYSSLVAIDQRIVSGLEVYPNPASDEVTVRTKDGYATISSITISDIIGKEMYSIDGDFSSKVIYIKDLPEGTYIIKVFYNEKYEAVRFVKQGN